MQANVTVQEMPVNPIGPSVQLSLPEDAFFSCDDWQVGPASPCAAGKRTVFKVNHVPCGQTPTWRFAAQQEGLWPCYAGFDVPMAASERHDKEFVGIMDEHVVQV